MRASNDKSNFFIFTLMIIFFTLFLAIGLWLHNLSISRQEPESVTLPTFLPEAHLTPSPIQATNSVTGLIKQRQISPQAPIQTQTQVQVQIQAQAPVPAQIQPQIQTPAPIPAPAPTPGIQKKFSFLRLDPHSMDQNLHRKLKNIFGDMISFNKSQSQGDHFGILRDQAGNILLATLTRHNKIYQAVRYRGSDGSVGYYTPQGGALWKSEFLQKPVNYTRITDDFTMHRWHPILHIIRPHYGIDYGAPSGTPVRAVASGKVTFLGWGGDYGNAIIIHHDQRYESLYAHLNPRGFHSVRSGQFVKKGQIIGYVGTTGLTTGPHLHFGLYEYGKAINPAYVLPKKNPPLSVAKQDLSDFLEKTNQLFMQFATMQNPNVMHG